MIKRFCAVVLPMLFVAAIAADTSIDAAPEVRRYTVEMIIFKYAQDVSVGSEVFVPAAPPQLDPTNQELALERYTADGLERIQEPETLPNETDTGNGERRPEKTAAELVPLAEEDYALNEIYSRMKRLDVYEPLMHFGWTQATISQEDTEVRPLASFARPPAGLDGDISLYLSRYLHLAINLQLDAAKSRPVAVPRESRVNIFGDTIPALMPAQPTRFRIVENRIVRNGELRYFDHPKFGVLAKVSRVEELDEEIADGGGEIEQDDADELLGDIPQ